MYVVSRWILTGLLLASPAFASADSVYGILRVVKGDVKIKADSRGETVKARLGEKVYPKDVIITAADSRAKIVMVDNNEINVSPDSQIEIQNYEYDPSQGKKNVLLNVIYGKVRSKVEQKYDGKTSQFQIKTPSAVAGVRGTDFITSYNSSTHSSSVITFRGKVEFGLPGPNGTIRNSVFVTPGRSASNFGAKPPSPPTAVPTSELAQMDHETKNDPGTAVSEPRSPANDPSKSDKNDKNDGHGNGGESGVPPAGSGSGPNSGDNNSRGPSSTSGASMVTNTDLPAQGGVIGSPDLPKPPPPPPPKAPTIQPPPCGEFCNRAIQGGKATLNVHVH
jgi:hypothetical protein